MRPGEALFGGEFGALMGFHVLPELRFDNRGRGGGVWYGGDGLIAHGEGFVTAGTLRVVEGGVLGQTLYVTGAIANEWRIICSLKSGRARKSEG